nr:MAG TPA: hypothetical protein [Caudoviricetes sp.]
MPFRYRLKFPRWDQFWNQRVLFGVLSLIADNEFTPQMLISSDHMNAFHTAW